MRAHVMHNYLDKKDDQGTRPEQPVTGGEKMRFRLTSDGLERKYPYRYSKSGADEDGQESTDAGPSNRPGFLVQRM